MWNFGCTSFNKLPNPLDFIQVTTWTPLDLPWTIHCPTNAVITGSYSIDNNSNNDRSWVFYCSSATAGGLCTTNCNSTGFVNAYDGYFNYAVPEGSALVGIHSVHDDHFE